MKTHFLGLVRSDTMVRVAAHGGRTSAPFDAFRAPRTTLPEVLASLNAAFPEDDDFEECSFENAGLNFQTL